MFRLNFDHFAKNFAVKMQIVEIDSACRPGKSGASFIVVEASVFGANDPVNNQFAADDHYLDGNTAVIALDRYL